MGDSYIVSEEALASNPLEGVSKSNTGVVETFDVNKIGTSSGNVLSGNFVHINEKYWGDNGQLTYKDNGDGTATIMENGQVLGFTDIASINNGISAPVVSEAAVATIETPTPVEQPVVTQPEVAQPQPAPAPAPSPVPVEPAPAQVAEAPQPAQTTSTAAPKEGDFDLSITGSSNPTLTASADNSYVFSNQEKAMSLPAAGADTVANPTAPDLTAKINRVIPSTEFANNPYDNNVVYADAVNSVTTINGVPSVRRKVENYTDADLKYMAQMVENEAGASGITGQVAVAEEIRNRVLSPNTWYKDTVTGVIDQGYAPFAHRNVRAIQPTQETLDLCKNVLDGKLWVFGRDDVLSHASHSGTKIYDSQSGVAGSSSYVSFYYDNLGRTQTFYTSGDLTEETRLA